MESGFSACAAAMRGSDLAEKLGDDRTNAICGYYFEFDMN